MSDSDRFVAMEANLSSLLLLLRGGPREGADDKAVEPESTDEFRDDSSWFDI